MSFKVSNVRFEESRRVVDEVLSSKAIELITSAATSNPYIATTQITALSSSYSITLPNAEPGTIKIMTLVDSGETNVTINYNEGYDGNADTVNLGREGDLVIFYASIRGWHTRIFIWD
jgi:hypothetical protein